MWTPMLLLVLLVNFNGGPAISAASAGPDSISATELRRLDEPEGYSPQRTPYAVRIGDALSAYRVLGVTVLPGETVPVEVTGVAPADEFSLRATSGELSRTGPHRWTWKAPASPGLYPLEVSSPRHLHPMTLNAFVVVPYQPGRTRINGYAIGSYPRVPAKFGDVYAPPKGFIELTRENAKTLVSPHFRLEQFRSKQSSGYPAYVALREPLLVKLETALEAVNVSGIEAETFTVMSGFRTPSYNKGLGNVKLSRHTWGDAADIYVDASPRDGRMDDLNKDGKSTAADAHHLKKLIERSPERAPYTPIAGGIGTYNSTRTHGPFVHVDARGYRARWGV